MLGWLGNEGACRHNTWRRHKALGLMVKVCVRPPTTLEGDTDFQFIFNFFYFSLFLCLHHIRGRERELGENGIDCMSSSPGEVSRAVWVRVHDSLAKEPRP